ncbi:hypothetical protein K449DRAFT_124157 [Hypoxylon sp. EC38]|nr:hypothetical protein K449DRAFT_124157 [Hypoxylon sp. EC38]
MSLLQSFRNLSPKARIGVGLGLLAWGAIGLQLSDRAEERYGFKPTEEDKAALEKVMPRITAVERSARTRTRTRTTAAISGENWAMCGFGTVQYEIDRWLVKERKEPVGLSDVYLAGLNQTLTRHHYQQRYVCMYWLYLAYPYVRLVGPCILPPGGVVGVC